MKDWKYFWHVSAIFCAMWKNSENPKNTSETGNYIFQNTKSFFPDQYSLHPKFLQFHPRYFWTIEFIIVNVFSKFCLLRFGFTTRREFFREILYKNIAIIAIQHGKFILLTPLAIFPILLGEIHSSLSGKFSYTY